MLTRWPTPWLAIDSTCHLGTVPPTLAKPGVSFYAHRISKIEMHSILMGMYVGQSFSGLPSQLR